MEENNLLAFYQNLETVEWKMRKKALHAWMYSI